MSALEHKMVGLIAKSSIAERADYVHELATTLEKMGCKLRFDQNSAPLFPRSKGFGREEILDSCDIVIVLGGDGTLLKTARDMPKKKSPIIAAVNMGTVGFLTEFSPHSLLKSLPKIATGHFFLDERPLLRVTTYRNNKKCHTALGLNDAVINQGGFARLITLRCEVNKRLLGNFHADGLIVSTATGSTGHSLSAGGPIVHPRLGGFILTPICPVKLSMRPIVIPSDRQITVRVETEWQRERKPIVLTIDGQITLNLRKNDLVRVRKSSRIFKIIRMHAHNYYPVLRRKLTWGE